MHDSKSRRAFLTLVGAGLATTLTGCLAARPLITFDLGMIQSPQPLRRRTSRTVVITEPEAIAVFDTDRVVVREPGGILSYLPEAQWSDRLPRLVQTRMLQSFQDSRFPNIGRPDDQLSVAVTLATELRAFEVDVTQGRDAVVTIAARLVDEIQRRIYATSSFTARVPMASVDPVPATMALDQALQNVVAQLMQWTAANA